MKMPFKRLGNLVVAEVGSEVIFIVSNDYPLINTGMTRYVFGIVDDKDAVCTI